MSLYRTYRPKAFADLVGQDAVVRTLTSALQTGKLAHAYLFSGPRGSGKTSAAKILARCIECENGPTPTPDNSCEHCRSILAGTALDVLEIDAASNRGIDEIRALRDAVKFAPSAMRMKVYIIDEAHMLTKEGANAFLKTLEEPPAHAVFILATTEPEKLPVTILSRCQRYAFRRIAIPVMIERMREIAHAEGITIDERALSAIAYRADGGLRDALTMLEQAAAFADGVLTAETIDRAFGASGRDDARAVFEGLASVDAAGVLQAIERSSDAGTDMNVLMRNLIAEFRNALVAQIDPKLLARDLAPEDAQLAAARSTQFAQPQIGRALRLLSDALSLARSSGNPRLELETALLRYLLEGASAVSAVPAPMPAAPKAVPVPKAVPTPKAAPTPKAPPAPEPQIEPGPITVQKLRAAWQSVRSRVESERPPLRAQLARAVPEAIEGTTVVLKLPDELMVAILKDHAKLIESALADVFATPLRVRFAAEAGARSARKGGSAPPTAASLQDGAEDPDDLLRYLNERIPG